MKENKLEESDKQSYLRNRTETEHLWKDVLQIKDQEDISSQEKLFSCFLIIVAVT